MPGAPKRRARKLAEKTRAEKIKEANPNAFCTTPGPPPEGAELTKGGYIQPPGGVGRGRPPIRPKGKDGRTRDEIAAEVLHWYARVPLIKTACARARIEHQTFLGWMNEDSDFGRQLSLDVQEAQANQVISLAERLENPDISSASVKALSLLVTNYSKHEMSMSTKHVNHTHGVDASLAGLLSKASKDAARPSLPSKPHQAEIREAEVIDVTPKDREDADSEDDQGV